MEMLLVSLSPYIENTSHLCRLEEVQCDTIPGLTLHLDHQNSSKTGSALQILNDGKAI